MKIERMLNKTKPYFFTVFALVFFTFILWIIFLANTGSNNILFDIIRSIPNGDKFGHFFLYGMLTLVINLELKSKTINIGKYNLLLGTVLVCIFVVLEELSQGFIPSRTLDYQDLLADAMGIYIFTFVYLYISKNIYYR